MTFQVYNIEKTGKLWLRTLWHILMRYKETKMKQVHMGIKIWQKYLQIRLILHICTYLFSLYGDKKISQHYIDLFSEGFARFLCTGVNFVAFTDYTK